MADRVVEGLSDDALVLLVGASGSGKSTWAAAHFAPHAILSSDVFRALVADDAADQSATADAFGVLHRVAGARLHRGLCTVIDATNLTRGARRPLLRLAVQAERPAVAIVFDISLQRCLRQNLARPDRSVPEAVIRRHRLALQDALGQLPTEGFARVVRLRDDDIDGP